jgi:hypothetical protein
VLSILILADEEQDRRASKLAVNADCAGDVESREITSGMVAFFNGTPVMAEYIA